MDGEYQIQWVEEIGNNDDSQYHHHHVNQHHHESAQGYIVHEITQIPNSIDQIAAENLIYMAQDGQVTTIDDLIEETVEETPNIIEYADDDQQQYFECQVTEEIITDDWVQQQGEERVEIPVDQICGSRSGNNHLTEEIDVPLPTDQDEYTTLRPYPCDFCSRRFRKKVNLMNHMVAHQNDRPNVCNLCGARYIRKSDLLNHLKTHAHIPEQNELDNYLGDHIEARSSSTVARMNYFGGSDEDLLMGQTKPKLKGRGRKPKVKMEMHYSESDKSIIQEEQITTQENTVRYPITDARKPFVCQQCGVAFTREKALSSHTKIHGGDSPYECGTCNEMFWDLNALSDHQKIHHFDASNSEYEPENDEESDSEDSKYGDYYCNICGMSFHRQDLLKRHTKTHIKRETLVPDNSNDSKNPSCNVCGETFAEALDLLAHAEVHARYQPHKCTLCGETFLEPATVKKHLSNVHSEELTENSCRLCGKQCKDSKALMKHSWDHSREKNHSCSKCGKNFHNKARLKRHMVSHRNKSVICEVCQEEFPDGRSLMNHRHSHSNTSGGRQFPCYECGKTFGSRSSQQIHVRIHTGERPYGCRYCWKAFADGGTLRKHERIHTGEKPYACSVCPRAFNQRVVLREHIRAHHSALDATRGTYFCTVCCSDLPSSGELIQHLIQHSDLNTAMQRQPVTGPRKYKRRRKLKPHELIKLRHEKLNNSDYSDLEMQNVDDLLGISNKNNKRRSTNYQQNNASSTSANAGGGGNAQNIYSSTSSSAARNRKYSGNSEKSTNNNWQHKLMSPTTTDDTYNGVFQNIENALNNIDSLVVGTTTSTANSTVIPGTVTNQSINSSGLGAANTSFSTNVTKNKSKRRGNKQQAAATEKPSRPKMIHTQKTRVTAEKSGTVSGGKRGKTKTFITRSQPTEIDSNHYVFNHYQKGANRNEYEMIVPTETIKQEHQQQQHHTPSRSDLLDAQLLLEAATMRKDDSDKFIPDIINDLDDILHSPIKSAKSRQQSSTSSQRGRQQRRFQKNSFVIDDETPITTHHQSVSLRQSPQSTVSVLTEVITPSSQPTEESLPSSQRSTEAVSSSLSIVPPPPEDDFRRRSARLKRTSIPNKRYLEYDMTSKSQPKQSKIKQEKSDRPTTEIQIKVENNSDDNILSSSATASAAPATNKICIENITIKSESYFQCEMCCAVFPDRAQLLVHVPIHI